MTVGSHGVVTHKIILSALSLFHTCVLLLRFPCSPSGHDALDRLWSIRSLAYIQQEMDEWDKRRFHSDFPELRSKHYNHISSASPCLRSPSVSECHPKEKANLPHTTWSRNSRERWRRMTIRTIEAPYQSRKLQGAMRQSHVPRTCGVLILASIKRY